MVVYNKTLSLRTHSPINKEILYRDYDRQLKKYRDPCMILYCNINSILVEICCIISFLENLGLLTLFAPLGFRPSITNFIIIILLLLLLLSTENPTRSIYIVYNNNRHSSNLYTKRSKTADSYYVEPS